MYAATLRLRFAGPRRPLDNWYHPLSIGQALPTLPIWLDSSRAISLDLPDELRRDVPGFADLLDLISPRLLWTVSKLLTLARNVLEPDDSSPKLSMTLIDCARPSRMTSVHACQKSLSPHSENDLSVSIRSVLHQQVLSNVEYCPIFVTGFRRQYRDGR